MLLYVHVNNSFKFNYTGFVFQGGAEEREHSGGVCPAQYFHFNYYLFLALSFSTSHFTEISEAVHTGSSKKSQNLSF